MTVPVHSHAHLCWRPARARCALPSGQPWNGLRSASAFLPTQPTLSVQKVHRNWAVCMGKLLKQPCPKPHCYHDQERCIVGSKASGLGFGWPIAHERRSQPGAGGKACR